MTNDSDLRAETVAKLGKHNLWGLAKSVWLKAIRGVTLKHSKWRISLTAHQTTTPFMYFYIFLFHRLAINSGESVIVTDKYYHCMARGWSAGQAK